MALTTVFHKGVVTSPERAANGYGTPNFGVYGIDDFKVGAHPSIPFAVMVRAGRSHRYGVTSIAAIDEVVQCDTLSSPESNKRWDLIVVRDDWSTGTSVLAFITVGTSPIIPTTLANDPGVLVEQPLALVRWQGGTSAPIEFIDLRCWAANGGIIAVHALALKYLGRPGADVQISGVTYRYQPVGNNAWDWVISNPRASGSKTISFPASYKSITQVVQLPAGFSAAPIIGLTMTSNIGFPGTRVVMAAINKTASQFEIKLSTNDGETLKVTYSLTIDWIAVP